MTFRTRWMAIGLVALLGACDDDDGGGSGSGTDTDATSAASSSGGSAETGGSSMTSGPSTQSTSAGSGVTSGSTSLDADTSAGPTDGSTSIGPETGSETAPGSGSESEGGDEGGGSIDVTLTGCDVDFGGTIVVSYNGSLGVASVYDNGASLTGSFQFDLDGTGSMTLSSQHRVDTGNVINMVDIGQGTWTNLDSDALSGGEDSIGGTLDVDVWNPSRGQAELTFNAVSLMNVVNGNVCTIDGTVVAEELYP